MPEYAEQRKEIKKNGRKINRRINEKVSKNLEDEFQSKSNFKEKDELDNDFIPFDEDSNNLDIVNNTFQPIDDNELTLKAGSNIHPDERRRIRDEKQTEDVDKKYIKEQYIMDGKPIEVPKFTSNDNSKTRVNNSQEIKDAQKEVDYIELKESADLAEMVSIILGDGNIPKYESHVRITLNKTEEPQYREFVYSFMQKLFKKKPNIYKPKDANAVKMTISSKNLVRELIKKGLKSGDKKENQVDVPQWIKKKKENRRRSIRGLIDTDGSIHIHKSNRKIRITFKNASFPLINDYKEMCESFKIPTQKIYHDKKKDLYDAQIESKKDIVNFIETIKPRKWEYRAKTLGLVLISITDPEKREKIEKELIKSYPDKKVHFSSEYHDLLKNLCKNYGYNISDKSIFNELENSLTYNNNWTRLKKPEREILNEKAKKVISDLKKKLN